MQHAACLAKPEFLATKSDLMQRLSPLLELPGTNIRKRPSASPPSDYLQTLQPDLPSALPFVKGKGDGIL